MRLGYGGSGPKQSVYTRGALPADQSRHALQTRHFTLADPDLLRSGKSKVEQTAVLIEEQIVQADKLSATDSMVLQAEQQGMDGEPPFNLEQVTNDVTDVLRQSIIRTSGAGSADKQADCIIGMRLFGPIDGDGETEIILSFLEDLYFQARLLKVDDSSDRINATTSGET